MPRLMRTVARTAVIAGTATAVSGGVSRRQQNRWAQQQDQQDAREQSAYQQGAASAAPPATDTITQLQQLADLKNQGILTDQEFAAQKAKILGS
jgi:Short C-terminal domain